ncbi:E6 [Felis catus papillomavirus 3]|uniref:Protein E6 n=1 Tax=Felis catus papillomavirus 3 TaxID=1336600 RepID=R4V0R3_9PAPI|nr:E6 [Felis catus papillomavirus 3]AGM37977.1 E6 [Felis catus papillomavirus 3]AVM18358.1 early protein 6 [Felis catus papillomavirus 3]UUK30333.1 E6 [Felis catus papillomavirus 3]UUK30341.1 E6 [Felis catus papillomavirus 3]UUK30349.1 E6 [Felis catus papillomavirus 3]
MAKQNSFAGIAELLGVPAECILVQCCFCGRWMTERDKIDFDFKKLGLILQNRQLLGACTACCGEKAAADVRANTTCCLEIDGACALSGKSVCALPVRCTVCLKELTLTEKLDCCAARVPLQLVRGVWRGPCRLCFRG